MITALPSLPIYDQLQIQPLGLSGWRGGALQDARLDVREGD